MTFKALTFLQRQQRPDCNCEHCYWWKADRKELRDQIICFLVAVFVTFGGIFYVAASSCH